MSESQAQANYTYIDLDDPPSWWASVLLALLGLVMAAVIIAPWFIDLGEDTSLPAASTLQSGGTLCRPDTEGLPAVLNPSIGSWSRLCEWFIEPELGNP